MFDHLAVGLMIGITSYLVYAGIIVTGNLTITGWLFGGAVFFALATIVHTINHVGNRIVKALKQVRDKE